MASIPKTFGLRILDGRKIDIMSELSAPAKAFFQPDQRVSLANTHSAAHSAWNRAVRKFTVAAAACGLVAGVALAPTPVQAQLVDETPSSELTSYFKDMVNLQDMRFSDLVAIRDRLGLDEATLRDHGMPMLDEGSIERMHAADRTMLVVGLYHAANSLARFDRAMAEARTTREQRGAPAQSEAEEVRAWQHQLDTSVPRQAAERIAATTPAFSQAALEKTIQEIQILTVPRASAVAEMHREYERQRP
ncbi:hypothetical protein [Achromobacter aegrifaciens]|uniref:hypothetical protein n=1 Tax=Achromobacter aegrifaciens TaxID=1287736 RepID=UPI0028AA1E6D|nr:hypothetical protein [Achromobacter aegrifaciens]